MAPAPTTTPVTGTVPPLAPGADLVLAALRAIDISQVLVASGSIGSLRVAELRLGEATVDRLVVQGVSASVHAGGAFLEDVRFVLELRLSVDWWYDIWIWSDSGTESLGSLSFGIGIGNVLVPSLRDIDLSIPSATVADASVTVAPVRNLDLGGASFRDLRVDDTKLPASGFGLNGLQLGAVNIASLGAPDATARSLGIGAFAPRGPLHLPAVEVANIRVPAASVPNVVSQGAVNIDDAQATRRGVRLNLGILGFTFWVAPVLDIHIGTLTLSNVSASAGIDRLRVEGVSVPVTVQGVTAGDLRLDTLTVNQISL
jgi:hypothetical protein